MTLNEFLGMDDDPGRPRFDDTERNLWRALQLWEADLCPGCGQPQTRSLFNKDVEDRPSYGAGFVTCMGCKELLDQQEVQRLKDSATQHAMEQPYKQNPQNAPHLVTGHRHYRVWENPATPPATA